MILSKTSSYAIRILMYMASKEKILCSAEEIYEELGIKKQYMRRLLTDLTKAGFIKSTRGRNGGYAFARNPEKILISEVIGRIDGFVSYNTCILGIDDCRRAEKCSMHKVWDETKANILSTFRTTSIAYLASYGLHEAGSALIREIKPN